ncbi:MAG: hypothetical protein Q9172_003491 [Xanthocarpia lactea]
MDGMEKTAITTILQIASQAGVEGELLTRVGPHIASIISGLTEPLSLLLEGGLLHRFYAEEASSVQACSHLIQYLERLVFKYPHMKILEIGAGTGATTLPVLQALSRDKQPLFARYDFTDISAGIFPLARNLLRNWSANVNFQTLDVEQDPIGQGFPGQSYDLVIAANVLHATDKIDTTLVNVRKLLKPEGRLAFARDHSSSTVLEHDIWSTSRMVERLKVERMTITSVSAYTRSTCQGLLMDIAENLGNFPEAAEISSQWRLVYQIMCLSKRHILVDEVARSRHDSKTYYLSLSLGLVGDSEIIRRNPELQKMRSREEQFLSSFKFLRVLQYVMGNHAKQTRVSHIAVGFDRKSIVESKRPGMIDSPVFSHLPYDRDNASAAPAVQEMMQVEQALTVASNDDEKFTAITSALKKQVSALLATSIDNIDLDSPMENLGLDSLIAVELKTWIVQTLQAAIQTSEILDTPNLRSLASTVQKKSSLSAQPRRTTNERAEDPRIDSWLYDPYNAHVYLKQQAPNNPWGVFFGAHAPGRIVHSQAERAAIISATTFQFKQRLGAGEVEAELLNGQALCMDSLQWLFNSIREPGASIGTMQKFVSHDPKARIRWSSSSHGSFISALNIRPGKQSLCVLSTKAASISSKAFFRLLQLSALQCVIRKPQLLNVATYSMMPRKVTQML